MVPRRDNYCEKCQKANFFDMEISKKMPRSCSVKQLKKNGVLFEEGDQAHNIYLLKFGSLRFYKTWEDGSRQIVRIVFPGELIGYPALLAGDKYSVTAKAREDSTICIWKGEVFLRKLSKNPEMSQKIMILLSKDLRQTRKALLSRSILTVEKRLAQFVIDLSFKHGKKFLKSGHWASIPRSEASEVTGARQETVSRILHNWKASGLVSLHGKHVLVKDLDGLACRLMGTEPGEKKVSREEIKAQVSSVWSVLSQ